MFLLLLLNWFRPVKADDLKQVLTDLGLRALMQLLFYWDYIYCNLFVKIQTFGFHTYALDLFQAWLWDGRLLLVIVVLCHFGES